MNRLPMTIAKHPELKAAEDYYRLRREGIGFISQMGSSLWTDYNTHDPGITILEALCYAITDLAYRIGWDIKDILAPEPGLSKPTQPYPDQAFFTAGEILTVNPTTPDDFRRLLIDLDMVRNAWVFCNDCVCDAVYYAWCEQDRLTLSYEPPEKIAMNPQAVWPKGVYEALLELEDDPELGDLNDHKIETKTVIHDADGIHPIFMELRFPGRDLSSRESWELFLLSDDAFNNKNGASFKLRLIRFGATKDYDLFSDLGITEEERNRYVRKHWRNIFYLSFEIELMPSAKKIVIENAALRVFGDQTAKDQTTAQGLKAMFEDKGAGGFIMRYRRKAKIAEAAVKNAKTELQSHRNLGEDYCLVKVVGIEEVAVCADVEVKPDADIELVQARIWFEIEQYFNPAVPFYSLQELLDSGADVEEVLNGPILESGFIKAQDIKASSLKSVLRVSDLINRLMDIDGVIAVNQMQLTKYDSEGNVVEGVSDPALDGNGNYIFDNSKTSASWLLFVSKQHQPRLYLNGSRFLFYKNGLPFKPRMDEAADTLTQLRGESERPKMKSALKDIPVPPGNHRALEEYFPIQHSLPLTYGTGPAGLPSHASSERRAQARQLKAYLMAFEQLLGNAFAQVAHAADLFSLNPSVECTYFVQEFNKAIISSYDEIVAGLDKTTLKGMAETKQKFYERRNRFLDHLLARFGEQFSEYALLLTNMKGQQIARSQLIDDKVAFIKDYPEISRDRAKAFDYTLIPNQSGNQPGIKKRIARLLGHPDIVFVWTAVVDLGVDKFRLKYQLTSKNSPIFTGHITLSAQSRAEAELLGRQAAIKRMSLADKFKIAKKVIVQAPDKFVLRLKGKVTEAHGQSTAQFNSEAEAAALRDTLVAWSSNERVIVVEHLLLRPKFPGDALYPVCADGACQTCGDEDPYSFRLTFVMPGWVEPYDTNMEMRSFADRTIRQETPSHLLAKICWIDKDEFAQFEEAWSNWLDANSILDWTEERLHERLIAILATFPANEVAIQNNKMAVLCKCAEDVLAWYGNAFHAWMQKNINENKKLDDFRKLQGFTQEIELCSSFKDEAVKHIEKLLQERYMKYVEVSFLQWNVVSLLGSLNNRYPAATLHDWDEGSDQNPVRLGQTALGS